MAKLLTTNIHGDLTVTNQFTLEDVNVNQKLKEIDKLKLDIIAINEKIDKIMSIILPDDNEPPADTTVPVTSIKLNNNYLTLEENEKDYLFATINPDNATNKNIIWSSNSNNIATVDNKGCVTAIKPGNAIITARSEDGNKIDTCNITVNSAYVPPIEEDNNEVDIDNQVIIKYPATRKGKPSYWGALGDSITAGHNAGGISYSYATKAARRIGCEVHNHGYTGSCISDGYDLALSGNIGYETAFCNRYKEMANGLDLITVFGGFNDCRNGTPLGNFGSTNSKDFYGALHVLITGLKTKYPNARIVFITPFKIDDEVLFKNKARYKMKDYRNAIVRMCNKFELEVLDLSTQEQFGPLLGVNSGYFLPHDPYHPTQQGHIAIANYLVNEMFDNGTAYLNPPSAVMRLNETKTFTVKNSYNSISNAFASTNCINITSRTNNTITITAIKKGMDSLSVMLDNGQYLTSVRIDVI